MLFCPSSGRGDKVAEFGSELLTDSVIRLPHKNTCRLCFLFGGGGMGGGK